MKERLKDCKNMFDHEVLEVLLFGVCPRVNTNPLAHNLLDRFCSLAELFRADIDELKEVEGVGENIAVYLKAVGECAERAGKIEGGAILNTPADCKQFVKLRFFGRTEEFLELYFIEKGGRLKRIYKYTDFDKYKVGVNGKDILKNISLAKPYAIIAAHNHLNGSLTPSENDNVFTGLIQFLCTMNDVKFIDHYIYDGQSDFFSYRDSDFLDKAKEKFSMNNIVKWIMNLNLT
ncbi:MAG: hypothetical protein K2L12_01165 [Clostridia bacterium]|nr:hypothetical protein [Clostridia bacterium]